MESGCPRGGQRAARSTSQTRTRTATFGRCGDAAATAAPTCSGCSRLPSRRRAAGCVRRLGRVAWAFDRRRAGENRKPLRRSQLLFQTEQSSHDQRLKPQCPIAPRVDSRRTPHTSLKQEWTPIAVAHPPCARNISGRGSPILSHLPASMVDQYRYRHALGYFRRGPRLERLPSISPSRRTSMRP
jgi:hypothetical protein